MGFRFRRSIKVLGVKVNFGSKGVSSVSLGGHGVTTNISKRGSRTTLSIPGTGLSYTTSTRKSAGSASTQAPTPAPTPARAPAPQRALFSSTPAQQLPSPAAGHVRVSTPTLTPTPVPRFDPAAVPATTQEALFWSPQAEERKRRIAQGRHLAGSNEGAYESEPPVDIELDVDPEPALVSELAPVSESAPRRLSLFAIAWLAFCGLMAFAVLLSGQFLNVALIAWVGLLPATPLRIRVARRWSHYLVLGVALFVAAVSWSSYQRNRDGLVPLPTPGHAEADAASVYRFQQAKFDTKRAGVLQEMRDAMAAGKPDDALKVAEAWPGIADPDFQHAVRSARDAAIGHQLGRRGIQDEERLRLMRQLRDDGALTPDETKSLARLEVSGALPGARR
jgi:hypothetical protein